MNKVMVVLHSGYGHTRRVAEHVARGCAVPERHPGALARRR